jgi:hypothetical protein
MDFEFHKRWMLNAKSIFEIIHRVLKYGIYLELKGEFYNNKNDKKYDLSKFLEDRSSFGETKALKNMLDNFNIEEQKKELKQRIMDDYNDG